MKNFRRYFIFLCIFLYAVTAYAQDNSAKIDAFANKYYEYGLFNGAVLAAENGKIVYEKGFGMADKESNILNDVNTKFRIGSVTKQFTAMLIMQLMERGKLRTTDYISQHLPYFRKDIGDKVTIHHLLTHTSGIPNYTELPGLMMSEDILKKYTTKEFIAKYAGSDLEFEPGSEWKYSNTGYYVLGAIIEEITGKSYAEVLKENILEPLGMNNSGVESSGVKVDNYSIGYNYTPMGLMIAQPLDMSFVGAAGAMYSTVRNLLIWDRALYTNKLVTDETKKLIFTPYKNNYGYGWGVSSANTGSGTTTVASHTGGINGFSSVILRSIDDDKTVIVLNNIANSSMSQLANGIAMIFYGKEPPAPKQNLLNIFVDLINKKGVDEALTTFRSLKDDKENYSYSENDINNYGYLLLQSKKTDDAIKVFELNTELFPEGFNTWDSLGEAWMVKGDKEKAIKYYKKSLELNPDSQSAKNALKKLES